MSNKLYNPEGKKPPVPIDAEEMDSVMERFIRQKYVTRTLSTNKKGDIDLDERPPPLPPKTPSRFGLRSASSLFPLGGRSKKSSHEPTSPREVPPRPPPRPRSPGVFGARVDRDDRSEKDDTEQKLAKLRDMGFTDEKRNAMVLKGVGGNLEKAVEALIRLGEGNLAGGRSGTSLTGPPRSATLPVTRTLTLSAPSNVVSERARPISPASTNPFDMLDTPPPPQPLSTQSTGTLQTKNPYLSTNPFGVPPPAPSALDQAFQNLSLAPASQPLFPHHTGGMIHPQNTGSLYQPPLTAPLTATLPTTSQGYSGMMPNGNQSLYAQQLQPQITGYSNNPFFAAQQPQPQPQPQLSVNTTPFGSGNYGNNPFTRSPTRLQSPSLSQIPEQSQQNHFTASSTPQPQPASNPFFAQAATTPGVQPQAQLTGQLQQPVQATIQLPQQQVMGLAPQMTGYYSQQQPMQQQPQQRVVDKASILALYNYPQLAPQPTGLQAQNQQQQQPQQQPSQPQDQQQHQQQPPASPQPGSKNPFAGAGLGKNASSAASQPSQDQPGTMMATPQPRRYNASRESMMALGMEWSNGRHSPDAFASLSARDR